MLLDIFHRKYYKNVLVLIILMKRKNVSYFQDLKACYDSENAVYLENMLHMPTHMLSFIKNSKGIIIQMKK